jgi:hypothetical protein
MLLEIVILITGLVIGFGISSTLLILFLKYLAELRIVSRQTRQNSMATSPDLETSQRLQSWLKCKSHFALSEDESIPTSLARILKSAVDLPQLPEHYFYAVIEHNQMTLYYDKTQTREYLTIKLSEYSIHLVRLLRFHSKGT